MKYVLRDVELQADDPPFHAAEVPKISEQENESGAWRVTRFVIELTEILPRASKQGDQRAALWTVYSVTDLFFKSSPFKVLLNCLAGRKGVTTRNKRS